MTTPRTNASHDQNFVPSLIAVSSADGKTPVPVEADPNTGALITFGGSLLAFPYDYVGVAYPDSVTEVYTFKTGGSGGSTSAIVTVVYSDATKVNLTSVTRS